MRATLLLADHAVVADGKLYINGGGWSVTSPGAPSAIADQARRARGTAPTSRCTCGCGCIGQDGEPVTVAGSGGPHRSRSSARPRSGGPAGLVHGADIDFPLAFQSVRCRSQPGQRYQWVLDIDGETQQDWHLTFSTRAGQPAGPATYVVDP